jgi:adenosylhomocysteinase
VVHRADPDWPTGRPNMILDDGGDATLLVHKGVEFEKAGACPPDGRPTTPSSRRPALLRARSQSRPERWTAIAAGIKGVTEETTTGVHRLYEMLQARRLAAVPGDQRQRLGHQEQVRQQVRLPPLADRRHQPRHRRADRRQGRRGLRLRRRRQGLRGVAARPGRSRHRHRDRPDLRAAGGDGRLPGHATAGDVVETADIFVTATGNDDVITVEHMQRMKHQAIVGNIGHFDNEIDMAASPARAPSEIKPQVDRVDASPTATRSSCCPRAAC